MLRKIGCLLLCAALLCAAWAEVVVTDEAGAPLAREDGRFVIRESGTYRVTGSEDGVQIVVETAHKEETVLLLDGASFSCPGDAAILGVSGDLELCLSGENSLSGGGEHPAAVYSKDDIVISGEGRLTVTGDIGHGVESRDCLQILGGELIVEAAEDALRGRERLEIRGGRVSCRAGNDGLKANSDKKGELGEIVLSGGEISLDVGDDAVHAEGEVTISGGELTISACTEGVEGATVEITGGTTVVRARDDGVNANGDAARLALRGGTLLVYTDGDGVDSNGDLLLCGGTLAVHGTPDPGYAPIDFDGGSEVSGGVIAASGSRDVLQKPVAAPGYATLCVFFGEPRQIGERVSVRDADGALLVSFVPEQTFQAVIFACPGLTAGREVSVTLGGEAEPSSLPVTEGVTGDEPLFTTILSEGVTCVDQRGASCDYGR